MVKFSEEEMKCAYKEVYNIIEFKDANSTKKSLNKKSATIATL